MRRFAVIFLLLVAAVLAGRADGIVRDVATLQAALRDQNPRSGRFEIVATVTSGTRRLYDTFVVTDGTGTASITDMAYWPDVRIFAGDRVRVFGEFSPHEEGYNYAYSKDIRVISHDVVPPPVEVTPYLINHGDYGDEIVRFEGHVVDAFRDETDLRFVFFVISSDDNETVYVATFDYAPDDESFHAFIDAYVSVTGLCFRSRTLTGKRRLANTINANGPGAIRVLNPPPADPYDVPELAGSAEDICGLHNAWPRRRRAVGVVLAVWHGDRMLIKRPSGEIAEVTVAQRGPMPSCGEFIEAVGVPDTDLYRLNLSRATWRGAAPFAVPDPPFDPVGARELLTNGRGMRQVNAEFHGQPVDVVGRVIGVPAQGTGDSRLVLDCDGVLLQVDFSAMPETLVGIGEGMTLEITGTAVVDVESWRPQVPFPRIESCFVVPRSAADVTIVDRPSWWTPGRLLIVIGSLLVALVGAAIWNRSLTRLADRRGHQLMREQIGRARADLKAEERTRLSVELHDTLAQNLTGAAMEIATSRRLGAGGSEEMLRHLAIADKTLTSCREELRNCLWDLRSRALEAKSLDAAILKTLSPHVNKARLAVRFNVRRNLLPDDTTHAVLRIVRELALNGIRHGGASTVRIAGEIDGDRLLFSVDDNGAGFDPSDRPGVLQGHFGLEGVRERVEQLGGVFTISSAPGKGAYARVEIPLSRKGKV